MKVDTRLASAFTAAVQLEMQSLREHSQQMSALHQGMQTQINSMQADFVQQQRQTEDLQAQINNTKTVDLQHKLVSVKFDAVELNKVQLDKAKVDAAQLSDMQGLEEGMQTHIISMQADADRRQQEMKGQIYALQTQVKDLNLERQTQIDGNKDRLADADRRQQEVQNQMDDLQQELRVVKEALSPPPPPTSARPIASSGNSSPPQPPPPPLPPNPVARLLSIVDEPRRQCCPQCRSATDGTTCPVKPLPYWSYMSDYVQIHWGQSSLNVPMSHHFADNQGVELSPTSWPYQLSAVEELFFFEGGVDRVMCMEILRCIEAGLGASTLEVVWHKTKSSSHIVLGLRCRECGFMVGAEWCSPQKYPIVKQKVDSPQVALACLLSVDLPESLNDGPRAL